MSKQRKHYNKAFREEAVKLVTEQGYSVLEASNHLGITTKSLYNWKAQLANQNKPLPSNEQEELKEFMSPMQFETINNKVA